MRYTLLASVAAAALASLATPAAAQAPHITTPEEQLGHHIGEDYYLASYAQLVDYWKKLAAESDRLKMVDIGATAEGRRQYMMIASSPENMRHLDEYRDIARRLAQAKGLTDNEAQALAEKGKAVVWIDGGLHANEVVPAQALMQAVYKAAADNDPEWLRILNDDIILFVQDNPDGQDLNVDWYMRVADPKKREVGMRPEGYSANSQTPQLWQKYIGHDNNRDFYMGNQPETTNILNVAFREWFPQIIYNHHQPGPTGAVVFMPPFRDPFNYNYDPLVMTEMAEVGMTMHSRLVSEHKPGSTMRSGATYSTWFNGSLRTVSYFHNSIGLLTEIIGNPTPIELPLKPDNQLPHNDLPDPVKPQTWHLSQSIAYSLSMDRAVLDYASRNRQRLLFNIYRMGADEIKQGSEDSWTITPKRITALEDAAKAEGGYQKVGGASWFRKGETVDPALYDKVLHDPAHRDPRGYIIPADQPDLPTAVKFLDALIKNGVEVERADKPFTVAGKQYGAGSFVVMADQAYRPHILDMFEPQNHPQDFAYPGGPPIPPYDSTGYTLALQMGVKFDRILDGFDGPFTPVDGLIAPPPGQMTGTGGAGWLLSHETNNAFIVTNRLMKAGLPVSWLKAPMTEDGRQFQAGAIWVPASAKARAIITDAVRSLGVDAYAVAAKPSVGTIPLKPVRIGLVDVYGGSMPSGWTRWLFDQFEFPYKRIYPQRLDKGDLNKDFDVLVFPGSVYRENKAGPFIVPQPKPEDIPAEYRSWLGNVTVQKTLPRIEQFIKSGGSVITVGDSNKLALQMGLPIADALTAPGPDGKPAPLPTTKFYIPGSLLAARTDSSEPLAYGMPDSVDMFYDNNPTFRLAGDAPNIKPVSWFSGKDVLRSGWAWGQEHLDGTDAVLDISLGQGKLFMMGPEVNQRGQSWATFKLLFNGLYYGPAVSGSR